MYSRIVYSSFKVLGGLLLIVILGAVENVHAQQGSSGSDGSATLRTLQQTTIPTSDRIDLAERFNGLTAIPTAPASAPVYSIDDTQQFWCSNADSLGNFQVTAQLVYATAHVYVWFQSGEKFDLAAVKSSADVFESHIYPTVHSVFGSERSPGIDGDVHLYILHAHNLGSRIRAYFSSADSYPKAVVKTSNEHNMFFINLDTGVMPGTVYYEGILAHEFQHMVEYAAHPNQDEWLNEGLSELSRGLNGYITDNDSYARSFLIAPETQLNTWIEGDTRPHYGAGYLFTRYFSQRFGTDAIHALLADPKNGLAAFDDVLPTLHPLVASDAPKTVADLFADWQIANLLNDPKVADGRYGYTLPNETLPPVALAKPLTSGTHPDTIKQWGTRYLQITAPGTYTLHFSGQPTVRVIPTDAHSGHSLWWAGRNDQSDARLTHDFDLSSVTTATLDFWIWHSIEKEWDYGYVEVSTDGGKTWQVLKTSGADPNNPNDTAYGAGYTGNSGAPDFATSAPAKWIEQRVDLSAYAGKAIKIRFEYITDDAIALPGMALDDIQIPQINYSTDAETDNGGWQTEGWSRIDNTLPQRYLIQEVAYGTANGSAPQVTRLLNPSGGISGDWTIKVGGDVPKVVISVSGMTLFTTEDAPYTLTLAAQP